MGFSAIQTTESPSGISPKGLTDSDLSQRQLLAQRCAGHLLAGRKWTVSVSSACFSASKTNYLHQISQNDAENNPNEADYLK